MRNLAAIALAVTALTGCTIIPPADPAPPPPGGTAPQSYPAQYPPTTLPPPASQPPAPETDATLTYAALGQPITVGGPRITPVQMLEDSRCPMNARCVWAGHVRLRVRIDSGRGGEIEMTSGKPASVADGALELVEVRPDKVAGGGNNAGIAPHDYRFGFRFSGGY